MQAKETTVKVSTVGTKDICIQTVQAEVFLESVKLVIMSDAIRVICRFRPQNKYEKAKNAYIVVRVSDDHTACLVSHPDTTKQPKPLTFNFDCVFDWTSTQLEVFEFSAKHLVDQIFDGFNATIFAYGQTGIHSHNNISS